MKIFKNWRQRKSRQGDHEAAAAASNTIGCLQAHQLQECDHQYWVSFSGADPYLAAHSSMKEGIPCPQNYSDYKESTQLRKKENMNTVNNEYDMDLLIYQYTLQNAFLSIGTLGAELLSKLGAEMNDDSTIICNAEKDCDEGVSDKKFAHTTSQMHPISEVGALHTTSSDQKVQVEMLKPSSLEEEIMCESSIFSSSHNIDHAALLLEKLREGQKLSMQDFVEGFSMHKEVSPEVGSATKSITFEGNTTMCSSTTSSRSCPSSRSAQETHGNEDNGINELKDIAMEEILMGLYGHEEVAQTYEEGSGIESTRNMQGMINMGSSRSDEWRMSASSSGKRMMDSSSSAQGIMGSSYTSAHEGKMGSSYTSGSSIFAQGMKSLDEKRSKETTKQKGTILNDDEMNMDYGITMGSSCNSQWRVGSFNYARSLDERGIKGSNAHSNLKTFILSVTPLLKRLKVAKRHIMGRPHHFNYQRKFYKEFIHALTMKRKHFKMSCIMKRELGPPAVEEVQSKGVDEESEIMSEASRNMAMAEEIHHENWIDTDDEYVVLELEGNKQ